LARPARQRLWLEVAVPRVGQEPVDHAVERVALVHDFLVNERPVHSVEPGAAVHRHHVGRHAETPWLQVRSFQTLSEHVKKGGRTNSLPVSGRSDDDAVKVFREHLYLLESAKKAVSI
jgi:hypothetical protein